MKSKDDLKKDYKNTPPPMGLFLVRNIQSNRFVLGPSRNLSGSLNRLKFSLQMAKPTDTFLNAALCADFKVLGEEAFEFSVLDTLKPNEDPAWDPAEDLKDLEKLWLEELRKRGWEPY